MPRQLYVRMMFKSITLNHKYSDLIKLIKDLIFHLCVGSSSPLSENHEFAQAFLKPHARPASTDIHMGLISIRKIESTRVLASLQLFMKS